MFFCLFISWFSLGCEDPKPQTNEDCVVYYDKCNSGCDPICGTVAEKEAVESGEVCDLGCVDSGSQAECVLVDDACQWSE